jgi:hypothetical protein
MPANDNNSGSEARRIAANVAKAAVKEGPGNQPGLLS